MRLIFLIILSTALVRAAGQSTLFETSGGTQTPTYAGIIDWWQKLDKRSTQVKMLTMGQTDAGQLLHLVLVGTDGVLDPVAIKKADKRIILINNGIHPGEPDGIDASMLLARDIVNGKAKLPANVVLAIIPVYNIGGCLDRSPDYRVDQNGPEEFGFRGNSQNLDLNRDFIKSDSREAQSFAGIFHLLDPDVFVDNHVSNGADYQHVMTLLSSQHNRLGGVMGEFMNRKFEPGLYEGMRERGFELIPYVNFWGGGKVDEGWQEFWDSPRYGSGYVSLWQTYGFMPETHMLKPYELRVKATYALMLSFINFTSSFSTEIRDTRAAARQAAINATGFPIRWKIDRSRPASIKFLGYESGLKTSEVSGLPRLYYDRAKPFVKQIPFYNQYTVTEEVEVPAAYIIPQGWWKVIRLLQLNKVSMRPLQADTSIQVEVYHIEDFRASARAYEGHHINTDIKLRKTTLLMRFRKGDLYIPMNQRANRFLVETLEPGAEDSYFSWNFFDGILGQKEGYSAYAFEDIAAAYLKEHPELQQRLQERRATDSSFASSASAQLNFIYQQSPWLEPAFQRYPVYRVPR